jgi:BioD-like phosphotransacetylase family protein
MKYKNIYVAASSQHVGKTTSTLGLVSGFMKKGLKVGYCKPVGQQFLDVNNLIVDKDTVLFADLIHFDLIPQYHSPVILGKGATENYLDNPDQYDLHSIIHEAKRYMSNNNDITIYEGTGHPGVGSVAGLSNAMVAKLLDAGVVMIVEGGIGSTIDMLNMCTAIFRENDVPIVGVIINKVREEKIQKVEEYVSKWLNRNNLPLLGVIPYDQTLAYPLIRSIAKSVSGTIIYNSDADNNKVASILAGSLIDLEKLKKTTDQLLVVATKSLNGAIKKIERIEKLNNFEGTSLSGILATGQGTIDSNALRYIEENNLPLIRTHLDTYGCVVKISKIEVKINLKTPWKVKKAIQLIEDHVDFDRIMEKV